MERLRSLEREWRQYVNKAILHRGHTKDERMVRGASLPCAAGAIVHSLIVLGVLLPPCVLCRL